MIAVTRLDGREIVISADQIETVEATPDTVISLVSGRKYIVKEATGEVIKRVLRYKGQIQRLVATVGKES